MNLNVEQQHTSENAAESGYNFEEYEQEFTQNINDPMLFMLKHLTD